MRRRRFFTHQYKVLRKFTRVVNGYCIYFYIVRERWNWFYGLLTYQKKDLRVLYDRKKIPDEDLYMVEMAVKAFKYTILTTEHELMTSP